MKRTIVFLLALAIAFTSGLSAASLFQKNAEKKADDFSAKRPILILAFDITQEKTEEYETKKFIPDTTWQAKFKKFFTKKEYGTTEVETHTRNLTLTDRIKVYTQEKSKSMQMQEITSSEATSVTVLKSVRIFTEGVFWEIKRGADQRRAKINIESVAISILPDWYYMHRLYMKEAIETEEKLNDKLYRLINSKWIRYYIDKDTMLFNTVEIDLTEKNKIVTYKVKFSKETFVYGDLNLPKKVRIFREDKFQKEYMVSVVGTVDRVHDMMFVPETQQKEVNRPVPKKKKKTEEE